MNYHDKSKGQWLMRNIKMIIQYDGSKYKGWQRLGNTDMTIQGKIENVLSKMANEEVQIIGSGRTDAGVHALNQVANFHTNSQMKTNDMLEYCYNYLPSDIVVKSIKEADERFHSRYNTKGKKYLYRIWNDRFHDPFLRKYVTHIPDRLNIEEMIRASTDLIGSHDFSSFTTAKSKKKSRVRTINSLDIAKKDEIIDIMFYGNGFLYNMVRIIVGTLIEVGRGNLNSSDIKRIMDKKLRSEAGPTAPSEGLFLYDVEY